ADLLLLLEREEERDREPDPFISGPSRRGQRERRHESLDPGRACGGKVKSIGQVAAEHDRRAPQGTAEDWDNVGLLVGDSDARTGGAAISIDMSPQALDAAIRAKHRLIITHHPCIFPKGRGPSRILASHGGMESLIHRAIEHGVSIYSTHTNF